MNALPKSCYHCGKAIKGPLKITVPSNLAISLGDFVRAYHPKCYEIAVALANKSADALAQL